MAEVCFKNIKTILVEVVHILWDLSTVGGHIFVRY